MFVSHNVQKQTDFLIEGDGYAFECYAPYFSNDLLEITFDVQENSTSQTSIKQVIPFVIEGNDTVQLILDNHKYKSTYNFRYLGIKRAKRAFVLVEYEDKTMNSFLMKRTH